MATASVASTVQSSLAPPSSANRSDTSSPIATNRAAAAHDSARAAEHILCSSSVAGSDSVSNIRSIMPPGYDTSSHARHDAPWTNPSISSIDHGGESW